MYALSELWISLWQDITRTPLLRASHVVPPSSVRYTPPADTATYMRSLLHGSGTIVCRTNPPLLGTNVADADDRTTADQ